MLKALLDRTEPKGIVIRKLYNGNLLKLLVEDRIGLSLQTNNFDSICKAALDYGLSSVELEKLLDKSSRPMFAGNLIWKFIKKHFDIDLVLPFLTGVYTTKGISTNLVTTVGHKAYADQIGGTTSTAFTAIAYGTGTNAAAIGDTALQTEVSRGAATVTNTTVSATGDTEQWVKSFTAGGSQAITEEGILNNNSSGGILLARQVFSAINMVSGDVLQFTHKITS